MPGKKYIKIVQDTGVFCFIVKEDFKHFKKGDILKAAGYNAPALNSARGNVLTGNYPIQWTGPLYIKIRRNTMKTRKRKVFERVVNPLIYKTFSICSWL